uniref:Peptidase aspartic putative domain-containing protein n=1 Tax=Cacopsylla melanoneura TaxID=428564 RepID=A0A8D8WYR9_9HEMI
MAPPIPSQITSTVETRQRYFARMQKCYDCIKDETQEDLFIERAKQVEEIFTKFENCTDMLNVLNNSLHVNDKDAKVNADQPVASFEDMYFAVKAHLSKINHKKYEELNSTQASSSSASDPTLCSKVKLPVLNIPIFSGDLSKFPAWKSLFDELIHRNNDLTDIQKFSYLKSYLDGPAASCIECIELSGVNYILAYRNVYDRYSRKRIQASNHFNKLLAFPTMNKCTLPDLYSFLDNFNVPVQSLRALNIDNLGEFMMLHLGLRALDPETGKEFEKEMVSAEKTFPTFEDLIKFIKSKCSIMELNAESNQPTHQMSKAYQKSFVTNVQPQPVHGRQTGYNPVVKTSTFKQNVKCALCSHTDHRLQECPQFLQMSSNKRFSTVKEIQVCFQCLSNTHSRYDCHSNRSCRKCGRSNHHTLLHPETSESPNKSSTSTQVHRSATNNNPSNSKVTSGVVSYAVTPSTTDQLSNVLSGVAQHTSDPVPVTDVTVLLGTAMIRIQDTHGQWHLARCVIDGGSQISAISENLAQLLQIPRQRCNIQISGIGTTHAVQAKAEVWCNVLPHSLPTTVSTEIPFQVKAIILPKIAADLPTKIPQKVLNTYKHLQLADSSYFNNKLKAYSQIDLLIGAEYYTQLLEVDLPIIQGVPSAIPTKLGWLLMGRVESSTQPSDPVKCVNSFFVTVNDPLTDTLQQFWQLESLPSEKKFVHPDDELCEQHFIQTHQRTKTGQYMVQLPFKPNVDRDLGSNRQIAFKRLCSLDSKFRKNPEIKTLYNENLQTYLDNDHMEPATQASPYLLVHFGLYKESRTTTKMRVVFDPNIPGSNGKSLSDLLMIGPKLQADIADILVNFRLVKVALTSDIQAMYRSVLLHPADRKYQHIIHRFDNDIVELELKTVTFGLGPSPFQAQRVIQQLLQDEGERFPQAKAALSNAIYVDDVVTGASSVEEARHLQQELSALFDSGGFKLRKWASSCPDVLSNMSEEVLEKPHPLGGQDTIKVLGLQCVI